MIDHHGAWLPSVAWGLPILAVLAVLALAIIAASLWTGWRDDYGINGAGVIGIMAVLTFGVMLIGSAAGYWPWKSDYHKMQPTDGIVQTVDSRFLAASQYVVVTYQSGLTVRCDDSRCAALRTGDRVRLLCTKEHQLGSPLETDGWYCRWGNN